MKSEKATQILLLAAGLVFFLVGIFRGEAAVVLSKAIKLCMECVGIGLENEIKQKLSGPLPRMDSGSCYTADQHSHPESV